MHGADSLGSDLSFAGYWLYDHEQLLNFSVPQYPLL